CQSPTGNAATTGESVLAGTADGIDGDVEDSEQQQQQQYEMYGYAPIGSTHSDDSDSDSEHVSGNADFEHFPDEHAAEAGAEIEEAEPVETPGLDRLIERQLAADELLPSGSGGAGSDSLSVFAQPPPADPASSLAAVWRGPPRPAAGISEAEAAKIREAMRGVRLPAGAAPDWAHRLPEREWKDLLVARLSAAAAAPVSADAPSGSGVDDSQ
ncbi:hypothetical protein BOX15_Mlig015100g1, partial [Macrostomum lignano]